MTASTVHASPVTAAKRLLGHRWPRTYVAAALLGMLLAVTGALGSDEAPLLMRSLYWLALMLGGTAIAHVAGALFDRLNLPLWPQIAIMLVVITPVIAAYAMGVTAFFTQQPVALSRLPVFAVPSFVIALAMSILHTQINQIPAQSHAFETPQATTPGEAFRARLPFKQRHADIYALSAEDHYLRVHTSAGEALILMRLYDAIRELDGIEGSQTHRSWWVAKDAVTDTSRGDGKAVLILKNGLTAPVSRSYVKALKTDGWL